MKIVFASVLIFSAIIAAFYIGEAKTASQMTSTLGAAQESYLVRRFNEAYTNQEVLVALWEGTNLVKYLEERDSQTMLTKEEKAARIFLNARLSALFQKVGDQENAKSHATKALQWFVSISTNLNKTPEEVVNEALAHDSLKRSREDSK